MRGDKVLWSGSRLITLSPWPCCRGGVRACVVCAYLDIVTWTCREVTITIWLLYRPYTIEARPVNSLQCPAIPNAEHLHYQNATMAPTPHKRDEGHEKSRHRCSPRLSERDLTDKPVLSDLHLLLELLSHTLRLRTKTPVHGDSPTASLHPRLPHLDTIPVLRVVTGMVLREIGRAHV